MSTDRELLELAAKAAGYVLRTDMHIPSGGIWVIDAKGDDKCWDPLTDDGDALRLAVRMCIAIEHREDAVFAIVGEYQHVAVAGGVERGLATRRAIVRAAAEITKAKGGAA